MEREIWTVLEAAQSQLHLLSGFIDRTDKHFKQEVTIETLNEILDFDLPDIYYGIRRLYERLGETTRLESREL